VSREDGAEQPLLIALVFGASFTALALLVSEGQLDGIDAYATHHLMPGLGPSDDLSVFVGSLVPFIRASVRDGAATVRLIADIVTLPAYISVSALLFAAGLVLLWRRGRRLDAYAWGAAFVAGNVVEVVGKRLLEKPALFMSSGEHVPAFDTSYPSGHAIRGLLVAGLAVTLWPRALPYAVAWSAAGLVMLDVAGFHTPSDIVGGALLAGFLVALACRRGPAGVAWARAGELHERDLRGTRRRAVRPRR
jgi:membrane-associated phospholipid phosphatase